MKLSLFAQRDFDAEFYLRVFSDFSDRTENGARSHFRWHGRRSGRAANGNEYVAQLERVLGPLPSDFNESVYCELNRDVAQQFKFKRGPTIHFLRYGRAEERAYTKQKKAPKRYDAELLHLITNRAFDMPQVVVDPAAPKRVNVLVPAFEFKSMSAGFFGVFEVARFILQCGFQVRLVLFDNFYWNYEEFKQKLAGYPGMERLYEELEIEYIGERLEPLVVSPDDRCVATVWYSAYFAEKIMNIIGGNKPFLYLIQDYETNFFPGSSLFALADRTYSMNFNALFSTEALMNSVIGSKVGAFGKRNVKSAYFLNACAAYLPPRDEFLAKKGRRRLAFYSRPEVNRNMFELGALALCEAVKQGIFGEDWDFYGVGMGDVEIQLSETRKLQQLERMNLKEYMQVIATFDIGLCLMASPHPSLLPFDLAGSGAVVVTNTFGVKTQAYFDGITKNIIAQEPSLDTLVEGMRRAVAQSENLSERFERAKNMKFPRTWQETFGDHHRTFIQNWGE
jgi:hypothetical protein